MPFRRRMKMECMQGERAEVEREMNRWGRVKY